MPVATFTLDDAEPEALRFPIFQQRHRIDVLRTLLQLDVLEAGTPLLIEERYLQERDGLNLLLRLRLEPALGVSRSPVFIRLRAPVESHVRHHPKYAVLCTRGVTLLREGEEAVAEAEPLSPAEHLNVLESLRVQPPSSQSRHDLANEWGPHRLWRGYARLASADEEPGWARDAFLRLRQQEYYAYLLGLAALRSAKDRRSAEADALAKYEAFLDGYRGPALRILLLDDEVGAGWGEAVRMVLEREGVLKVDTSLGGVDFDAEQGRVEAKMDEGWDLVLADLRTSAQDRAGTPSRGALHYAGSEWIRRIKHSHPETAVVAFTASNKAWSVQELWELGIDGYWIKESPEFGVDDAYSVANAARLLTVVRKALEPRINARPVWVLYTEFDRLAKQKGYVAGWARETGRSDIDVMAGIRLDSIRRRLLRAYGFLVQQRSAHAESAFAMDAHDLAFLSLWGIGNEVVSLAYADPPYNYDRVPSSRHDVTFVRRHPVSGQREDYWSLRKGQKASKPSGVPPALQSDLCPTDDQGWPQWPGARRDTARIAWLAETVGGEAMRKRYDEKRDAGRPGLRELRNLLEDAHGDARSTEHATLDDIYDLCEIWRAVLVTPYARS